MAARPRATAEAILERLLLVLPLAARDGGAEVDRVARELEVDPRRLLRDLEELEARNFYLPPGLGDQFQLNVTRKRISVWTTGEFRRPVRLAPREALALELALRVAARGGPDGAGFEDLARRLVEALRAPEPDDAVDPAVALAGVEPDDDPLRTAVEDAVFEGRELRIVYRAPGREAEPRRVGPLVLAHAEGRWYLVARDLERAGHRAFRLDRMLEAAPGGRPFEATEDDREAVERFLGDGRVHDGGGPDAPEPFEAVVEYSPRIGRWIAERGWEGTERRNDGSVRVRHRVVDPEWIVRHVLSYGSEARVLGPARIRERVAAVAREMTED